ncbi:MAG: PA2169 family four-helix-bundle protein [Burkholderiales bacterium]|nr:PA2169 family four-helix-bundle protein [Burkholderiales bacterium]
MADERNQSHDPITGRDSGQAEHGEVEPGTATSVTFPPGEAAYWEEVCVAEPYFVTGRTTLDYLPAYELGWTSYTRYGNDVDACENLMANDWALRKGGSTLSWDEARAATRAGWLRAENAKAYITDGSATYEQKVETLNDLLENARDGALGFREAAEHARSAGLKQLFKRRADTSTRAATELQEQLRHLGGKIEEGGTVVGAAHRVWTHIRGLFGGASDETMLNECERGEDASMGRYRKALKANLPHDIHALVLRQFEEVQRNHDMIRSLRNQARAENKLKSDEG